MQSALGRQRRAGWREASVACGRRQVHRWADASQSSLSHSSYLSTGDARAGLCSRDGTKTAGRRILKQENDKAEVTLGGKTRRNRRSGEAAQGRASRPPNRNACVLGKDSFYSSDVGGTNAFSEWNADCTSLKRRSASATAALSPLPAWRSGCHRLAAAW